MRNFDHSCKFCTLTVNFSEVWPRWILLQTTVFWVRLTNVFNTSQRLANKNSFTWWYVIRLQNVLKMSSRRICKTSWRPFEDVFKTSWQDVLKTSWRGLENVLKTSWRRLEDVLAKSLEDILKTSWRRMDKTNILALTKTSLRRLLKTYD